MWIAASIAETDSIVANDAKTVLAKGTATFINGPANLPKKVLRNTTDWIILGNCALLIFISVDALLAKVFLLLVLCGYLEMIHEAIFDLESFS